MATPEKYLESKLSLIRATVAGVASVYSVEHAIKITDGAMRLIEKDVRAVFKYGELVGSKGIKK